MSRSELREYILDNELDIKTKGLDEDELREAIRAAESDSDEEGEDDDDDEDVEEEEEQPKSKVTLDDIRKKLAGKK